VWCLRLLGIATGAARPRRPLLLGAAVALLATACLPAGPPPPPALYSPHPPAYGVDFPDPTIVNPGDGTYAAFSTNAVYGTLDFPRVPTATATVLTSWTRGNPTDALARPPAWQDPSAFLKNWAPAVHRFGSTWVLYFTAPYAGSNEQCIGVATSASVQGPYQPDDSGPIVCDFGGGGSIDPSVFVDTDGTPWLLWKTDGNCCQLPVSIRSERLAPDGRAVASGSSAHDILGVDQAWEDGSNGGLQPWKKLVEGPAMFEQGGSYWLLYSANWWDSSAYAIGFARCTSPAGGCVKPYGGPLLGSGPVGAGPGGAETFVDQQGVLWLVYHAWDPSNTTLESGGMRTMRLSQLSVANGRPVLGPGP
jgi:beta-xylosidase